MEAWLSHIHLLSSRNLSFDLQKNKKKRDVYEETSGYFYGTMYVFY